MNMEKISQFAIGSAMVLSHEGTMNVSMEQLKTFANLIIDACAQAQWERSCQRHGYDKYNDAQAMVTYFSQ